MNPIDLIYSIGEWILSNLDRITFSAISVLVGYVLYKLVTREIKNLKDQGRLETHIAFTITRISRWITFVAVASVILAQFGVTIALLSGLLTLLGGTIIGFAAINTIGNAIAGIIVMTSNPFKVGDRIFFKGQFADVIAIELIYTKLVTLDNVYVSIPNQELLKDEIFDFGKDRMIRRKITITPGYEYDFAYVEKVLLESASEVSEVLKEPKPYVWITKFQNYAVEYTLYIYTNNVKSITRIDAELRKAVFDNCRKQGIDISTPKLLKRVE